MILTVTLNPALDVDFLVSDLRHGGRYRGGVSRRSPGGSGVNISIILSRLGLPSIATGFLAGFNGSYILDALRKEKVSSNFVYTEGETRINVCVIDTENNSETRLIELGSEISASDRAAFMRNYERVIGRADKVCISGSLPPGLDPSVCAAMLRLARENTVPAILHLTEREMEPALEEGPAVVKLDYPELGPDDTEAFMVRAAELRGKGAEWVVALSGKKILFSSPKGAWTAEPRSDEMIYLYATDDALLSGMIYAMEERASAQEVVRWAAACYWECSTHPEKFPKDRACVETLTSQVVLSQID